MILSGRLCDNPINLGLSSVSVCLLHYGLQLPERGLLVRESLASNLEVWQWELECLKRRKLLTITYHLACLDQALIEPPNVAVLARHMSSNHCIRLLASYEEKIKNIRRLRCSLPC